MNLTCRALLVAILLSGPIDAVASAPEFRLHGALSRKGTGEVAYVVTSVNQPFDPADVSIQNRAEGPKAFHMLIQAADGRRFTVRWWQANDGEHSRLGELGREDDAIEFIDFRGDRVREVRIGEERVSLPPGVEQWDLLDLWYKVRSLPDWHLLAAAEQLALDGVFPPGQPQVRAVFCPDPPTRGDSGEWACSTKHVLDPTFIAPDCAFDAEFEMPCSDEQAARAAEGGDGESRRY